jgi:hypothetical protein
MHVVFLPEFVLPPGGQTLWLVVQFMERVVQGSARFPCMMIISVLDFLMAIPRSALMDCIVVPMGPHVLFAMYFLGANAQVDICAVCRVVVPPMLCIHLVHCHTN